MQQRQGAATDGDMTISDIAKMAGVSSAAVSRYLNGGPLSAEKRKAIHDVVERTGYRPDAAAQTLRTGRVNQIGIITPNISSQTVGLITAGAAGELETNHYLLLLANTDVQEQRELSYLNAMQRNHVAGIILMGTVCTPAHTRAFRECKVPLVITGQRFADVPCVYNDDRSAMRELCERMLAHGRRKIAYIGGPEKDLAAGLERRLGVQEALEEAGLDGEHMPRICCNSFTLENGAQCMRELLERFPEVDGVLCATDTLAIGAFGVLKAHGRRIGEDIGLAGVGDNWADTLMEPELSTVRFYQKQVGIEAARMLLRTIKESKKEVSPLRQVSLGYSVIERGSL